MTRKKRTLPGEINQNQELGTDLGPLQPCPRPLGRTTRSSLSQTLEEQAIPVSSQLLQGTEGTPSAPHMRLVHQEQGQRLTNATGTRGDTSQTRGGDLS